MQSLQSAQENFSAALWKIFLVDIRKVVAKAGGCVPAPIQRTCRKIRLRYQSDAMKLRMRQAFPVERQFHVLRERPVYFSQMISIPIIKLLVAKLFSKLWNCRAYQILKTDEVKATP